MTQYRSPIGYKNGRDMQVSRIVAEKALGRPLKTEEVVHHIDEDPYNNSPNNLVICPSKAYHSLLHVRTDALRACGNANYRKCPYCKTYDDPETMNFKSSWKPGSGQYYHYKCHADYCKSRVATRLAKLKEARKIKNR